MNGLNDIEKAQMVAGGRAEEGHRRCQGHRRPDHGLLQQPLQQVAVRRGGDYHRQARAGEDQGAGAYRLRPCSSSQQHQCQLAQGGQAVLHRHGHRRRPAALSVRAPQGTYVPPPSRTRGPTRIKLNHCVGSPSTSGFGWHVIEVTKRTAAVTQDARPGEGAGFQQQLRIAVGQNTGCGRAWLKERPKKKIGHHLRDGLQPRRR